MTFLPKIDFTASYSQVECQGTPQPSVHLTCLSSSCQGTATCNSCTADLTHAYVSSVECINYDAGEGGVTTCGNCTLEESSTPAGPASVSKSSGNTKDGGDSSSNEQVTTWLAWR
ncbi:hypothetical protein CROQUDRAFT_41463 [Cronartium quercuum f. sp. fusiforme G11]|uniref:Uncharacterized protein n=1 Tax=Cronartium quercuum f. sp. fusiforme G11 TaxID=708437 RepID=A0A9P6NLZ0_9BASI|nr:hypothetical protein CROQUDRAFT_41463 [Cronartium quercuum f. sp. fusiforme G11]